MITLQELKNIAISTHIPIMHDDTISAISKEITHHHCFEVLEIGTAIGYSSLALVAQHPHINITTLEKDITRYQEAIKYKQLLDTKNQITMVYGDAFDFMPSQSYDCIIIDGAKAANQRFFERFFPFLKPSGCMLIDNMDFHGAREVDNSHRSKQFQKMIAKLNAFEMWITHHEHVIVTKIKVGDGLLKITFKP